MNKELMDNLLDRVISSAFEDCAEDLAAELQTEEEMLAEGKIPHTFSPEFEKNMQPVLRDMRMQEIKKQAGKVARSSGRRIKTAAAAFAIFIGVTSVLVATVDAMRVPIMNFVLDMHDQYSNVVVEGKEELPAKIDIEFYKDFVPTHVPEGFYIEEIEDKDSGYKVWYYNPLEDRQYSVEIMPTVRGNGIDTENAVIEHFYVNKYMGVLIQKDNKTLSVLVWDEVLFFAAGEIMPEEMLAIMESLPIY